jgi:predicted alpha-1,2-mannosidase
MNTKHIFHHHGVSFLHLLAGLGIIVALALLTGADRCGEADFRISYPQPLSLGQYVNPFIGTGGIPWACGFNYPGASVPFGMVRLSPETALDGLVISNMHTSGYYYGDNQILQFSHTRLSGTGVTEGGNFGLMPVNESYPPEIWQNGLRARFSHDDENASPGYYAVKLPEQKVWVELTATERTGLHRYTFQKGSKPHLLLNVSSVIGDGHCEHSEVNISSDGREITGKTRYWGGFSGRYGGLPLYFVATFDQPFSHFATWQDGVMNDGSSSGTGNGVGADITFAGSASAHFVINVKLAISHLSLENARENLQAESATHNFDEIRAEAQRRWENELALIKVEGGSDDQKTIFTTALYHSFAMPTLFTDVNGAYLGFDKAAHQAEGFQYYTDLSLWDTFRTTHPLFVLIQPERQRDFVISLTKMAEESGYLPRWPSGGGETGSMLGSSADMVIADSYIKGITDFNTDIAYTTMKKMASHPPEPNSGFSGREGILDCLAYKFCPADLMEEAISRTQEFAYADFAIANFAQALGYNEDATEFFNRAQYYRNVWNPATQYFQPRYQDGTFEEPFYPSLLTYLDPTQEYTDDYVEGSALQWRWYVPYDVPGLISLFESREYFVSELNKFFRAARDAVGTMNPGPDYWHGNEPDIHAAYLFNYAGRPDLTQEWARWVMANKYGPAENGLDGNDDAGTLSAWYNLSALGFYPIAATDRYLIGSPLFSRAEVSMGAKTLIVSVENQGEKNLYVAAVSINGVPLTTPWFSHDQIKNGGEIHFIMSKEPTNWGKE